MKSVICALVIFILIITMIVFSCIYTENVVGEILQSLYKNENHVAKNNWETAVDRGEYISFLWNKHRKVTVTLFNHTIIERVDESIAKMNIALKMQKKDEFFYESSNLDLLLKSLLEQQKVSVGNVF